MKFENKISRKCEFKDRLKEAMTHIGISQTALVQATNIPKSAISQYLSGAFVPKKDRLSTLALALNVQEAWLMGYDVPRRRSQEYIIYDDIGGTYDDEDPTLLKIYSYLDTLTQEERTRILSYLEHNDSLQSDLIFLPLTAHESAILTAYREHPEMQPAVDRILGVSDEETVTLYTAAKSADNVPPQTIKLSKKRWEEFENTPKADSTDPN